MAWDRSLSWSASPWVIDITREDTKSPRKEKDRHSTTLGVGRCWQLCFFSMYWESQFAWLNRFPDYINHLQPNQLAQNRQQLQASLQKPWPETTSNNASPGSGTGKSRADATFTPGLVLCQISWHWNRNQIWQELSQKTSNEQKGYLKDRFTTTTVSNGPCQMINVVPKDASQLF